MSEIQGVLTVLQNKLQVHNFTLYNLKTKEGTATPRTKHREIYLVSCLHTCKESIKDS